MNELTKILNNTTKGFLKLHLIANASTIGPEYMLSLKNHNGINSAALTVGAVLTFFCIKITSYDDIGIHAAFVSGILSFIIVGLFGYLINLAVPADDVFIDDGGEMRASGLAAKWSSFLILNFTTTCIFFLLLNGITYMITGQIFDYWLFNFIEDFGIGDYSNFLATAISSVMAATFIILCFAKSGKIVDGFAKTVLVVFVTTTICILIFSFIVYFEF